MAGNSNGGSKKHEALSETLREIVSKLEPGDRLPSQTNLMRQYKVSDRTVLRSLDDLRREGWIVRRHGSGTFVADPATRQVVLTRDRTATENSTIAALALTFGPFYQHCVDLLSVKAESAGLALVCHHASHEASFEDALPLEALNPRGFIIFSYYLLPIAKRLIQRGHRVVIVGAPPAGVVPEAPCVHGEHDHGAWMACRHLIDLGHRRIGFAFANTRYSLEVTLRWKGHQQAILEARELGDEISSTIHDGETIASWLKDPAAARKYLRQQDAPTAIVAWNDGEAVVLLKILHDAGMRVPEDISVIGYGGLPAGETCVPPLTTVHEHVESQLRRVMEMLTLPEPPAATQTFVVVPTFLERASCAPPRS